MDFGSQARRKNLFFRDASSNYSQAKPDTFRLVPGAERLPELRRDYQLMRDMYLNEPASFDDILSTLAELEERINQASLFSLADSEK